PPQRRHGAALERDRPAGCRDQTDRSPRERRLAAAGLADEADDPPGRDGDARAGDGSDATAPALVLDDDVVQLECAHGWTNGSTWQARRRLSAGASGGTTARH